MKNLFLCCCLVLYCNSWAQNAIERLKTETVAEGKRLYESEMASWYGTDVFMEKYPLKDSIGGYFSYVENSAPKCIFFSKGENPKVIGTILFDMTFNPKTATADLTERDFAGSEKVLYAIRKNALAEISGDTIYKRYSNTNLNLIPLITNGERKVYVLTGPTSNNIAIFGNDYLLTFDDKNKFKQAKRLHANIIISEFGNVDGDENKKVVGAMHTHLPDTGDIITATDICTTMLYEKFAGWETNYVMSEKYVSVWDCRSDSLVVMTIEVWKKISERKKGKN